MCSQSRMPSTSYVHGTSAEEQARLSAMNEQINEGCLRELALTAGESVLDVGSGLGQLSRDIGKAVGENGRVLGIERDERQLAEAERQAQASGEADLVEFRQGDALNLPLGPDEWATFDVAFARFILEHVCDPLAVVRQMVAAVRTGGRIVLADDDHDLMRFWPEPPGAVTAWQAYLRSYDRAGNDPYVGRRLVQLLHEAGARPRYNTFVFFAACAGHPRFDGLVSNLIGVLHGARETVIEQGLCDPKYYDAAIPSILEWAKRPDAAFWYGICWAEGVKP